MNDALSRRPPSELADRFPDAATRKATLNALRDAIPKTLGASLQKELSDSIQFIGAVTLLDRLKQLLSLYPKSLTPLFRRGDASGKKYRIHFGTTANIQELGEGGAPRSGWCVLPLEYLVPGDVMLAQKIALETSEYATLAVANKLHPLPGGWRRDFPRPF